MNEFGEHGPTRDPALGDAAPAPEGDEPVERGTAPETDEPGETGASAGGASEEAGTDAARGALSEHE